MSAHEDALEALESFLDDGWISEVLHEVKSGKEATVYCCRGGERAMALNACAVYRPQPEDDQSPVLLAAKVYRPLESRRFKNDAIYQAGRVHLAREGRAKRAAENKSAFGRKLQYSMWLEHEWETMSLLHDIGADVPQPLTHNDRAILMPFLGDETSPAPKLNEVQLDAVQSAEVADRLLANIEIMLAHDRVHGDLSPFNVLYWENRATIIDFPQAIDPRLNPAGQTLLARDVENICRWAHKHGVQRNAPKIAQRLWSRFVIGEIG